MDEILMTEINNTQIQIVSDVNIVSKTNRMCFVLNCYVQGDVKTVSKLTWST